MAPKLPIELTKPLHPTIKDFLSHPAVYGFMTKTGRDVGGICKYLSRPEVVKVVLAAGTPFAVYAVVGFGATGPVAGTLAPIIQSTYYGGAVPAGSVFAGMQSLGMTGALNGFATAASAVSGLGAWAWGRSSKL